MRRPEALENNVAIGECKYEKRKKNQTGQQSGGTLLFRRFVHCCGLGGGSAPAADGAEQGIRSGDPLRLRPLHRPAVRRGQRAVIAVCNPEGNPVAVHVMDGAFLVSFDVAMKKAYTAVAVKMSTMELSKIAQPGGTFYGVDKLDGGKIVIFGGGIPLKSGNTIIGGLGISGGTGEEDHSLAEYGQSVLNEIL